jgi:hypothetical protein
MNAIQKTTFAAGALAITLLGAALVTAPLAFARPVPRVAQVDCPTPSLQLTLSDHVRCTGASSDAGLIALNGK